MKNNPYLYEMKKSHTAILENIIKELETLQHESLNLSDVSDRPSARQMGCLTIQLSDIKTKLSSDEIRNRIKLLDELSSNSTDSEL